MVIAKRISGKIPIRNAIQGSGFATRLQVDWLEVGWRRGAAALQTDYKPRWGRIYENFSR
jgi:hypothetical protein